MLLLKKKAQTERIASIHFMIEYLAVEIDILNQKIATNPQLYDKLDNIIDADVKCYNESDYSWTANPIDLVEVIESILHLGCINKGDVVKNDFYEFVGQIFNINLTRHSAKMNKICNRPYNVDIPHKQIHFIPKMLIALSQRIAELDEK